jgi:hypothetical protein
VKTTDTPLSKSAQPCTPLVTYMTQCEAREWKRRYAQKVRELGKVKAQSWWLQVKADIIRIRGQASADTLIAELNRDANTLPS